MFRKQFKRPLPEILNTNSNKPSFYSYSIPIKKCSNRGNNVNEQYAKLCVIDVLKDMNMKVFNLIFRTNQTRHETCTCKCRLHASVATIKNGGIRINADGNAKN